MKSLYVSALLLTLGLAGCGSPVKTIGTPPPPPLPNIAGTWNGTINMDHMTPNLVVILTEDSTGKLTGSVSSTSGCSCNFTVEVSGKIYADYSFSVQTEDATLLLSGSLANNNVDASGFVNIGQGPYQCGPVNGAPFALGKQ